MVDSVVGATAAANAASTTSASKTDAKKATLDYDNFLKLLIAQMKNQDPTNPMDATEQISQLATFSNVEQSIKMNTNLETLISNSSLANASSYIGKTITSADGKTSGTVESIQVTSSGLSATITSGATIAIGEGIKISAPKA